jgi:hypothetical protein
MRSKYLRIDEAGTRSRNPGPRAYGGRSVGVIGGG